MKRRPRRVLWAAAALLLAGASALLWVNRPAGRAPPSAGSERFITQPIDRGDIVRRVNASGALNPVNLVQVGTQVSGTIRALHVDYNSPVKAGQLLAEIDAAAIEADLAQAEAQVRSAQSALALAQTKLERNRRLFEQGYVARAEIDEAEASLASARASLDQQRAAVARSGTNRRNAQIRSPVTGTVVSREIAVGQTVAASLQTPVLFKIAQDLRDVQIDSNVSEADVGLMREGQPVSFTVDAFADRVYEGRVQQIRNNYSIQQNVVTYTVVVRARNDDLSLRPGMTGYVAVTVAARQGVLRIPNAALRYEPPRADATAPALGDATRRAVWRIGAGGLAEAVPVTLGLADTRGTELVAGDLRAGDRLIVGEKVAGGFSGPKLF